MSSENLMSSKNLTLNTFDLNILNQIEKSAGELYDEIHKVNNVLSGLLNIDCTNYKMITTTYIDNVKQNFIDNFDIFISNLTTIYFADLEEYSFDQLIEILSSNDLEIFKLKNLLSKDLNYCLANTEKEIYEYSLNKLKETYTMNKITFYQDIYNNPIIKNFINNINNLPVVDDENISDNQTILAYQNNNLSIDDIKIENIIKEICETNNLEYSHLTEMKYTLWDDKIELYEIKNIKTCAFIYVYFDLFKRQDKNEKNNLIYFDNKLKKICICYNFDDSMMNKEYDEIKDIIYNITKIIL
jgi:hypothetical protein